MTNNSAKLFKLKSFEFCRTFQIAQINCLRHLRITVTVRSDWPPIVLFQSLD